MSGQWQRRAPLVRPLPPSLTLDTHTLPSLNSPPTARGGSDGEYTAPTDEALRFDLQAVGSLGMNSVRLHQKVNSDRWYYWADTLGVVVLQDAVQKYGGASAGTVEPFLADLKAMMDGRGNHPSIIQWEIFNEGDCWSVFNVSEVIAWARAYDPHRLIDTDSGGGANDLHIGDVNDIHSYPWPGNPQPSATQYAMQGEYGGIGAFTPGREWSPGQCFAYLANPDAQAEAEVFVNMTKVLVQNKAKGVSVSVFTQITDVENECDGECVCVRAPGCSLCLAPLSSHILKHLHAHLT